MADDHQKAQHEADRGADRAAIGHGAVQGEAQHHEHEIGVPAADIGAETPKVDILTIRRSSPGRQMCGLALAGFAARPGRDFHDRRPARSGRRSRSRVARPGCITSIGVQHDRLYFFALQMPKLETTVGFPRSGFTTQRNRCWRLSHDGK